LKKVRKYIEVFIGLTGTPAPNGLLDLWSQVYLLDSGEALGRTLTNYRETYFHPGQRGPQGVVYNWRPNPGAEKLIYDRLAGLCLSMQNAVDLPDRVMVDKVVSMDPKTEELYRKLESDYLLPFAGGDIDAATAAILANKLLQFSGGAVYDENGGVREIHGLKLDALDSLIEEANGSPVLVFYNYVHEKDRILARHPEAVWIKEAGAVERWNRGEIPLLLANPASAGHGLNLQSGGHIAVWFSPTWNLEYYEQANKRLHRRGQTETVTIQHIIVKGTIDEKITRSVLKNKKACQDSLLEAVRAQIKEAVND
jgi:SNF2 family DNA or RNA helicase